MGSFRGDDDTLDREIATLEAIARVRLRRATRELNDLDRDLRALKAERARRRARALVPGTTDPTGVTV
ncbi:MAG TPA: hypothetical protein VEY07_01060 [Thermoplasmata archaeon]|nr:hypothetical protein [Thermoplasmata archaeon]